MLVYQGSDQNGEPVFSRQPNKITGLGPWVGASQLAASYIVPDSMLMKNEKDQTAQEEIFEAMANSPEYQAERQRSMIETIERIQREGVSVSLWSLPQEEQKRLGEIGVDDDLASCLEYNPQRGLTILDIAEVLAVWEGENDADDWRWILKRKDGVIAYLKGGCDYTGWDCQSWAEVFYEDYKVLENLLWQLQKRQRNQTWRESTAAEMGNPEYIALPKGV